MVAIAVLLLLHVPPVVTSLNDEVLPDIIQGFPVIAAGVGLSDTVTVVAVDVDPPDVAVTL